MRFACCICFLLLLSACASTSTEGKGDSLPQPQATASLWDSTLTDFPPHQLVEFGGIFDRDTAQNVIAASPVDERVAASYRFWKDKGATKDSFRITIMTHKLHYSVGDTLHVVHIREIFTHDLDVHHAGPINVYNEYVNGLLYSDSAVTGTRKNNPSGYMVETYDGPVSHGPGVEYMNAVTKYVLRKPGTYTVYWKWEENVSNTLTVTAE